MFTACRILCDGHADARTAVPLVVKSYDGRPIKIEGNPAHPDSNGGTDRYAQASILNLYDPDRATVSRRTANRHAGGRRWIPLTSLSKEALANQGKGLAFLAEQSSSPSRARLQKIIAKNCRRPAGMTTSRLISASIGRRRRWLSASR